MNHFHKMYLSKSSQKEKLFDTWTSGDCSRQSDEVVPSTVANASNRYQRIIDNAERKFKKYYPDVDVENIHSTLLTHIPYFNILNPNLFELSFTNSPSAFVTLKFGGTLSKVKVELFEDGETLYSIYNNNEFDNTYEASIMNFLRNIYSIIKKEKETLVFHSNILEDMGIWIMQQTRKSPYTIRNHVGMREQCLTLQD